MSHKRTYRIISSFLALLLFAGSGFVRNHCQMQMTSNSGTKTIVPATMSVPDASCCMNKDHQKSKGQFSNLTVCNCQVPVRSNTEILSASNVHFKVHLLFDFKKETRFDSRNIIFLRHKLPTQSSDKQPLYLKNSILLI
ncbi:MAG TPA: hypothetical protein VKA34_02085 [Balneolales bacterium]|nr:hypothetical protein [Balneolales bacterium]